MSPDTAYLDHAATTPLRPEVREAMLPFLGERFGNPSSAHRAGRAARAGLDEARRRIAAALGCRPAEVVFTSGGTEADNLAIVGPALAARAAGRAPHVVTTTIEHKATLAPAHFVAALGGHETLVPVDAAGTLDAAALDAALAAAPSVVSVMWVNNETGLVLDVPALAARCAEQGVPFHSDAVQAVGKVPIDLGVLPRAMLTVSGHKLGAPKGIGALIVRERACLEALVRGGSQQFGIRPGTENVAGAVALGLAVELAVAERAAESARLAALRDRLEAGLCQLSDVHANARHLPRTAHVASIGVDGADAEALLMQLDLAGICASAGSACSTGSPEPSHVLTALGVPRERALGTVRFSVGHETTDADVDRVLAAWPGIVQRVRALTEQLSR